MLESLDFHYDGLSSTLFGLQNVRTDNGLFEETFLPTRKITKDKVNGRDKSYHLDDQLEDLTFSLSFLLPDRYTQEEERSIKTWLFQDYYKEFYFDDFPDKIFYVMYSGNSKINHNGLGQGYITIEMESNSPYAYSPVYDTYGKIIVNDSVDGVKFSIDNGGDFVLYPEMWITTKDTDYSTVKIVNKLNGEEFIFNDLTANETIYINNAEEEIETTLPLTFRFDNFNNNWLRLEKGMNTLQLYGNFDVQFRYQFTYLP